MNTYPATPEELTSESDVEQKFIFPFLTLLSPLGLSIPKSCIRTKPDIRSLEIGKGASAKRYHPDYVAVIGGLPVLIVEAKTPSESLEDAQREARLYAVELNAKYPTDINPCRFCVVSNGLSTEVRAWDSELCIAAFQLGHADPSSPAFTEFLTAVSYDHLRVIAEDILKKLRPPRFFRAVKMVGGTSLQDDQVPYNEFGRILSTEFQHLFNPANYEDRSKIVKNAYVRTSRRERYVDEIDRIIRVASHPSIQAAELAHDDQIVHLLSRPSTLKNKILLLVGDVGAGKSTFVDYLEQIALPEEIRATTAWVRIDLNDAPVNKDEIYSWCRKHLISGIRATSPDLDTVGLDGLRKLYRKDIEDFDKGIGGLFPKDSSQYNERLADKLTELQRDEIKTIQSLERYLCTGRGRLLIVALDNCDKRDREEQLLMFEVAKWIQGEIRCLVILPIRHATFEHHRNEPPLDTALKDWVYRIEPPPFQKVLRERLNLILSEARSHPKSLYYYMNGKRVEFPAEKLERFLHVMMGALFEHKHYGRKIIIGLAGWNLRKAFELFLDFCRSGYISEQDIFTSQATGNQLSLPQGVVARVLLRTNHRYYDGNRSFVRNIFQCEPTDPLPDHFVRYRILSWLKNRKREEGPAGYRGYHPISQLISELVTLGRDEALIRRECRYLIKAGCILPEHLKGSILTDDDLITITPAGYVHLELACDFHYLAACAEDVWLADEPLAVQIHGRIIQEPRYRSFRWPVILQSAADFVGYLKKVFSENPVDTTRFAQGAIGDPFDLDFDRLVDQASQQIAQYRDRRREAVE